MEERDKRRIGEELEPGGRPKAPGRLALLQRFVNSHNHDFPGDWDRLGTAAKAQSWLREKELVGPTERITAADAAQLRELREAIRALVLGEPEPQQREIVRAAAASAPLTVTVDADGHTTLAPAATGVEGAVATLLGILHDAQAGGEWTRMKGCRMCGYAFFDRSKNRSAAWCAMSICGNRAKNRAYHRRRSA